MTDPKIPAPEPTKPMTEGELWSWTRSVMCQGADIRVDYDMGNHKGYEAYSARLDAASAERSSAMWARLETYAAAREAAAVAAERERCAKVCEDISDEYQRSEGRKYPELKSDAESGASKCAAAIRAG